MFCLKVIHRRLTAKNVLLANTPHGVVAKITGYGPSKDDGDGGKSVSFCIKNCLAVMDLDKKDFGRLINWVTSEKL